MYTCDNAPDPPNPPADWELDVFLDIWVCLFIFIFLSYFRDLRFELDNYRESSFEEITLKNKNKDVNQFDGQKKECNNELQDF